MTCHHWQSVCTACLCEWRTEHDGCLLGGERTIKHSLTVEPFDDTIQMSLVGDRGQRNVGLRDDTLRAFAHGSPSLGANETNHLGQVQGLFSLEKR